MNVKSKTIIIESFYLSFFLIAFISIFLPYSVYYVALGDPQFNFYLPGYMVYIFGTHYGLILIFVSMVLLLKLKVAESMILGFIGSSAIMINIFVIFLVSDSRLSIGGIFLISTLVGFYSLNFSFIPFKKTVKRYRINEVRGYILELPSIYDQITMSKILNIKRLKNRHKPVLKNLIEEMINNKEIDGELRGEILFLKKGPVQPILSEKIVPQVDYKKRLFGMIRLRKEINLYEAAEFLNIDVKDIESLLYDLAGEKVILGKFQGNKFFIESDIDQFIDVLDHSFKRWEEPLKGHKI